MAQATAQSNQGALERWARFTYRRRGLVVLAWVGLLAGLIAANFFFGGKFVTEFKIPGSDTQRAQNLLKQRFPARAGDSADVVFEASPSITDPSARPRVQQVLDDIAAIPEVASIESPFDSQRALSQDGTIARATVHFTKRSSDVASSSVDRFLKTVDDANANDLRVEAGGRVVAENERPSFGSEYLGLAAAVLILLIAFGSVIAMGLPLAAAIFGLGAGFSAVGLAANLASFPSFSPQFAAMIGLGVGIDYSLLIVTRFREGLHSGMSVEDAVVLSVTTSGRSVIFAGMVVAVAFLGLFLMGLPFVAALGTAGALIVVFAVLVATTLMPAALSFAGRRIDRWSLPFIHVASGAETTSVWYRLSEAIQRRPLPYFLGTAALLILLASPALSMQLGFTDAGNKPAASHSRRAYDLLSKGFGAGFNAQLIVVADTSNGGADRIDALRAAIQAAPNVEQVSSPSINPAGDTTIITVIPGSAPQDSATRSLVHRLRNDVLPGAATGSGARIYLTGGIPGAIDAQDRISSRMPLLFTGVIGLSFILLTVVFRSVIVAAKAAIMNLLSIGASYGVLVAIFQWGWFSNIIGIEKGPIETFIPMMMFAILFGLSMDYEVFLISRVREEYMRTHNNATAVSHGLAATARVITAAAAIMVAVFLTFVLGDERVIKEFGIGLATAIFVDATIVRLVLVPATMELLGDRNWWLPSWLDRIIPNVSLEGPAARENAPAATTAGPAGGQ